MSQAGELLRRSLVWDNHACMPLRPGDVDFLPRLEAVRSSGVDVISLNIGFDALPWETAVQMAATFRTWLKTHAETYQLVETAADIETARHESRLAVVFDIEGGSALGGRIELIESYYQLGVRWISIAYNRNNALGGGCLDEDSGLTDFGRRVVARMNDVGMVICCSHTGERTARQVIDSSAHPVIFSHSNARSVYDHPRNISDEMIKACAASGGVVGLNGLGVFLGPGGGILDQLVAHIDYVASLVGPEHVGLGLDYVFDLSELDDYLTASPEFFPADAVLGGLQEMVTHSHLTKLAEALLAKAWPEQAIAGLFGANHLRVARAVWNKGSCQQQTP